ncbi:MAG: hypothetical protein QM800_12560 [Paludibacter sp.]
MNNKHNQSIPQEVLDQVQTKIEEVIALLKPHAVIMTADERASALKVGDKSFTCIKKAFGYTKTNPEFVPSYLNVEDFEIDLNDADGHPTIVSLTNQLYNYLDDTKLAARSEAYSAALYYYGSVQQAAAVNLPGAKAIYDDLKQYFSTRSSKAEVVK